MIEQIDRIKELANRLPTGLIDPLALSKLEAEMTELKEAMLRGDHIDSVMEAGDVCYYAIKAEATSLIEKSIMMSWLECMSALTHVPQPVLLDCCIAKYRLRAIPGNPKNPGEERIAVAAVLHEFIVSEAQSIRYLIIKSGGMANKSKVEDVLMARHKTMDRDEAHCLLNQIEVMNEEWFRIGNPTIWTRSNVPEPKVEDYPEIEEVMK